MPLRYHEPPCSRHKGQVVDVKIGGIWGDSSKINTLIFPVPQRPMGGCPTEEPVRPRIKTVQDPGQLAIDLAAHWGHQGPFAFTQREFRFSPLPVLVFSPRFLHLRIAHPVVLLA